MVAGPRNQPPLRALPRKGRSYFPRADYRFVTWLQAGSGKIHGLLQSLVFRCGNLDVRELLARTRQQPHVEASANGSHT